MRTDVLLQEAVGRLSAAGIETPKLDAELLLARAAGVSRTSLFTWPEKEQGSAVVERFEGWIARRLKHEPVAYLLGDQEFYGRLFEVSPEVLIPRPETEHIIETVLGFEASPRRMVDIGTGSGCIAVTLALEVEGLEVFAVDISEQALTVARRNILKHDLAGVVTCIQSDLLDAVADEGPFDLIVSNPPYVETTYLPQMQPDVALYEPHLALFGGATGLEVIERLCTQAMDCLEPGGYLVMEFGAGQDQRIAAILAERGYQDVVWVRDLAGHVRAVRGRKALP